MAWPPAAIAADKAPGAPSSDTEHPDHHNLLAAGVNDTVDYVRTLLDPPTEVTIDFGSSKPQWTKTFTIVDASVAVTSSVLVFPSGNVATGRVGNDAEWDSLILTATPAAGSFTLTATAFPGPIVGNRLVCYAVATPAA